MNELKPILLTYEGKEYQLDFDRKSAQRAEELGLNLRSLLDGGQTITQAELLFYCAFLKNHKWIQKKKTDEILSHMADVSELMQALMERYVAPSNALLADEGEETKNVTWSIGE